MTDALEGIPASAIGRDDGFIWCATLPDTMPGDASEPPKHSDLQLFEDGQPLGPARSAYDDIRASGSGRYLHCFKTLYFSTSDNSSPLTNGRSYTYKFGPSDASEARDETASELDVVGEILDYDLAAGDGNLYYLNLPEAAIGDDSEHPRRSKLQLFEYGRPIGPAHQLHEAIAKLGEGRYSHWSNSLYFSTFDNLDPRTSKRRYTFRAPRPADYADKLGRIYVTPGGGYGNRFMILCSAMRIAELSGRTLYVNWQTQDEMPIELSDLFAQPYPFKIGQAPRFRSPPCRDRATGELTEPPRLHPLPPERDINLWGSDIFAYGDEARSLTFMPYDLFVPKVGAYFNKLVLKPELQARLDELAGEIDLPNTLAVHVRRNAAPNTLYSASDNRRDDISLGTYVKAIRIVQERYPHLRSVYIASNNDDARDFMRKHLGPGTYLDDRAGTGWNDKDLLREALVEMCLLSRCGAILRQYATTFSYVASMVNATPCITIMYNCAENDDFPALEWTDWTKPMIIDP